MSPSTKPCELLILGLGNILCGDDGLGVEAVLRLTRDVELPAGVQALDGGTLGLSLLGYLADARRVVMVDAVRDDRPPGSLVRLRGEDVAPAVRDRLSVHQVGVADLLDGLRLLAAVPTDLVLLGLVPETLELGLKRSAAVEAGLPALVEAVVDEAARLGFDLEKRRERPARSEGPGRRRGEHGPFLDSGHLGPADPHGLR